MGITEWVAVLVIFAVVYCLIKRYETRLAGDGHLRLDGLCFRC